MAANVRVELLPPPWVPSPYLNGGVMKAALHAAADSVIDSITASGEWEWDSTAEGEATVMVAFRGADFDAVSAEFNGLEGRQDLLHAIARELGI